MNYRDWEQAMWTDFTDDALWSVVAYRLGLFVSEIGWHDVTKLMKDKRTLSLSDQLYRALGSISANIAEGYSRGSGRDRARFHEYALGSARESRDWYYKGRHILNEEVVQHRSNLLTQIIRLLLTIIPQQRGRTLHEASSAYETDTQVPSETLANLLQNIPLL